MSTYDISVHIRGVGHWTTKLFEHFKQGQLKSEAKAVTDFLEVRNYFDWNFKPEKPLEVG